MRRLILDAPPACGVLWLTEEARALALPAGGGAALHLARAAPCAVLVVNAARLAGARLAAGWLPLPAAGALLLSAAGAPIPLSRAADGLPARRVWDEAAGAIPEAAWAAARVWGEGRVVALGGGPPRPVLRLAAGGAAFVTLPWLEARALPEPRIATLRGPPPRARLGWGPPHAPRDAGPGPVTLALRAGLACEVVWEA